MSQSKSPQVQTVSGKLLEKTQFKVTREPRSAVVVLHLNKVQIPLTWQNATKAAQRLRLHGRRQMKRGGLVTFKFGNVSGQMAPDAALYLSPRLATEAKAARRIAGAPVSILATGILSDAENNYKHGL